MSISLLACSNELNIGGKSAQDAFKDEGVVKLLKAAIGQDAVEAKRLIASGVNINALGEAGITPILWTLGAHDFKAMKMLLELGADPDKYAPGAPGEVGFGPLSWIVVKEGKKEVLQLLLDHGSNPNLVFGETSLLMAAVQEEHMDCAELLLQRGADINYSNDIFFAAMSHVQFGNALWVLNHGYTYNLPRARKLMTLKTPRPGQEALKAQALEIVDRLLAAQQKGKGG